MIKKGDIVIAPFPFTDLSSDKVRPVVVVSNNVVDNNVIVAYISSKPNKTSSVYSIAVTPDEYNNLKAPSYIKCSKLLTLDSKMILGQIGIVSPSIMKKLNAGIREVFGL